MSAKRTASAFNVGQILYYVPNHRLYSSARYWSAEKGEEVVVTRVGRQWIGLSNGREISAATMLGRADRRGVSCGGAFFGLEHFLRERRADEDWQAFMLDICMQSFSLERPATMTSDRLGALRAELGMKPRPAPANKEGAK